MTEKLQSFFNGKRVLILGFGREGRSTLEILRKCNCIVGIADRNLEVSNEISGFELHSGEDYLDCLDSYDIIMKTPGIALFDNISDSVRQKITSQTDLLLRFCENEIIGVTGTKGKSTTSSLICHILKECGKNARLIGNIGIPPLSEACEFEKYEIIVCEMSCHQLEYVKASPDIAVLLNIYEEHLDHYKDFYAYKSAKENIYRYMDEDGTLIYNAHCYNHEIEALPCMKISASENNPYDIYIDDCAMHICGLEIPLERIKTKLAGKHNLYNIAVAVACAVQEGCDFEAAVKAVESFNGLEHRLEEVRTVNGVKYINDSISTIPLAAIAAVESFNADTIILGGMDRGISYDVLISYFSSPGCKVRHIIALPDSGWRIADSLDGVTQDIHRVNNLEEAVKTASGVSEHCCVLSPAAASYGFYKNFEERGKHFKELVNLL